MSTFETAADTSSVSRGITVTGGNNAKGSWVELIASTSLTASAMWVIFAQEGGTSQEGLIDIGTGAASSESVLIPDLLHGQRIRMPLPYGPFPVSIASGTRIAARAERVSASGGDFWIAVIISDTYPTAPSTSLAYNSYGTSSGAADKSVTVDPGGTANTVGAYTEIGSSVSASAQQLYLCIGNNTNFATGDLDWLLTLAKGAAASEVDVIENIYIGDQSTSDLIQPKIIGPFPADEFQSQRLSAKARCSGTDATDRLLDVAAFVVSGTVASGGGGGLKLAGTGGLAG